MGSFDITGDGVLVFSVSNGDSAGDPIAETISVSLTSSGIGDVVDRLLSELAVSDIDGAGDMGSVDDTLANDGDVIGVNRLSRSPGVDIGELAI